MNTAKFVGNLVVAAAVLSSACICSASRSILVNDGFEIPNLGSGNNAYGYGDANPYGLGVATFTPNAGQGWTFTGTAGIAANGSGFNVTGHERQSKRRSHQHRRPGRLHSKRLWDSEHDFPNPHRLRRRPDGRHFQPRIAALTIPRLRSTSSSTASIWGRHSAASSSSFNTVTTPVVYIPAAVISSTFTGVNGANGQDNTDFIDNVSVNVVPEPSMLMALLGLAAIGLIFVVQRSAQGSAGLAHVYRNP